MRSTSSCWPKAFTSAWPVKTSSTWAFRLPVWSHWAMKRLRERAVMSFTASIDKGIVNSATSARIHEM